MNCLQKIRALRNQMTANEKKLADFMLQETALLRDYSSQQLANNLGISQSSVVKFSQKLGFRGYPDLKLAVNEAYALEQSLEPTIAHPLSAKLDQKALDEMLKLKIAVMTEVSQSFDHEQLNRFVKAIIDADKVVLFSVGMGDWVAGSLHHQLLFSGKTSLHEMTPILQEVQVNALRSGDLLVIFLDGEEGKQMLSIAQKARSKGAIVAAIGRTGHARLSALANIFFSFSHGGKTGHLAQIAAQTAMQQLIDLSLQKYWLATEVDYANDAAGSS